MTAWQQMLTYMFPSPIPAILAESLDLPMNIMFTRSCSTEKTIVTLAGRATRTSPHTKEVAPSFLGAFKLLTVS